MTLWEKWQDSKLRRLLVAIKDYIKFSINPDSKEILDDIKRAAQSKNSPLFDVYKDPSRDSFQPDRESIRASFLRDTLTNRASTGYTNHNKKSFETEQNKASSRPSHT